MDRATTHSLRRDNQSRKSRDSRSTGRAFLLVLDTVAEERRVRSLRKAARHLKEQN